MKYQVRIKKGKKWKVVKEQATRREAFIFAIGLSFSGAADFEKIELKNTKSGKRMTID